MDAGPEKSKRADRRNNDGAAIASSMRPGNRNTMDAPGCAGPYAGSRPDRYDVIPSSRAAVSPSMAARSASLRPGVFRMWSTDVWVQGNG